MTVGRYFAWGSVRWAGVPRQGVGRWCRVHLITHHGFGEIRQPEVVPVGEGVQHSQILGDLLNRHFRVVIAVEVSGVSGEGPSVEGLRH